MTEDQNQTTPATEPISDMKSRINLVTATHNCGFTMTFRNRITVSVRWGEYNYSDGKTTAELAAWDADNHDWVHVPGFNYGDDDVLGRCDTDEIAEFIHRASTMSWKRDANS